MLRVKYSVSNEMFKLQQLCCKVVVEHSLDIIHGVVAYRTLPNNEYHMMASNYALLIPRGNPFAVVQDCHDRIDSYRIPFMLKVMLKAYLRDSVEDYYYRWLRYYIPAFIPERPLRMTVDRLFEFFEWNDFVHQTANVVLEHNALNDDNDQFWRIDLFVMPRIQRMAVRNRKEVELKYRDRQLRNRLDMQREMDEWMAAVHAEDMEEDFQDDLFNEPDTP